MSESPNKFNKYGWLERVVEDRRISQASKLFAFALYRGANESGYLWANEELLESWIGHTSTGKTYTKVRELADHGWITVRKFPLAQGRYSNGYQLTNSTGVVVNTSKFLRSPKEPTEPLAESAPSSIEDFIGQRADGSLYDKRQPPPWAIDACQ